MFGDDDTIALSGKDLYMYWYIFNISFPSNSDVLKMDKCLSTLNDSIRKKQIKIDNLKKNEILRNKGLKHLGELEKSLEFLKNTQEKYYMFHEIFKS